MLDGADKGGAIIYLFVGAGVCALGLVVASGICHLYKKIFKKRKTKWDIGSF